MSSKSKYASYAKRIKIFKNLSEEDVEAILKPGHMIEFPEGRTIFHKGQLGSNLFIVFSGRVEIYDEDHKIANCRVGDCFGEMSVLNHEPHSATAVASTPVKLYTLTEQQINEVLEKRVAVRFLLNIIHVLSDRIKNTNRMLTMALHGDQPMTTPNQPMKPYQQ